VTGGTLIRTMHRYGFRCGRWATLRATVPIHGRDCYQVEFADGVTDSWVANDPDGHYEFTTEDELTDRAAWLIAQLAYLWADGKASGVAQAGQILAQSPVLEGTR
jgi:hypothetical protein